MVPGHIRLIARRKVMRFILSEEGRVGSRTALSTATLVAVSSLAAMIMAPKIAHAAGYCPDNLTWCETVYCCPIPNPPPDGPQWFCTNNGRPGCVYAP